MKKNIFNYIPIRYLSDGMNSANVVINLIRDIKERLTKGTEESEKAALQQQIDKTDRQIDNLVYELYDLTPEEIAIVEKSSKGIKQFEGN